MKKLGFLLLISFLVSVVCFPVNSNPIAAGDEEATPMPSAEDIMGEPELYDEALEDYDPQDEEESESYESDVVDDSEYDQTDDEAAEDY